MISIHLTSQPINTPNDSDDELDSPADPVNFIEQEDGTTIEVMKKPLIQGEEVVRQKGGRIYRLVSYSGVFDVDWPPDMLDPRSLATTWLRGEYTGQGTRCCILLRPLEHHITVTMGSRR